MIFILFAIWGALFVGGLVRYSGSWLTYTIFSLVFLGLLISALYRQVTYGYLFFAIMLWLGFWFKLTFHLLVDYPFSEPIGFFVGSAADWNEVLKISSFGGLGVLIARLIFGWTGQASSLNIQGRQFNGPEWYPAARKWLWAALICICLIVAIANSALGIMQVGMVSRTTLLWPLNAVMSWLLSGGLALAVLTLLWWDISFRRNVWTMVYVVLLEGFTSTVSMLSRGVYLFHVFPQLLALYENRGKIFGWSRRKFIALCTVFMLLFSIANPLVNTLRSYYYSDTPFNYDVSFKGWGGGFVRFAVDRWVGLEGVMAVSAYPSKSSELLKQGIFERREVGKHTFYQEISQSHYRFASEKFMFASIPGAIGFLYYADQLWVVVIGMCVLTFLLMLCESWAFRLTGNPLLCAFWGGMTASVFAQLAFPRSMWVFFLENVVGILVIYVLQSERSFNLLRRIAKVELGK